MHQSFTVGFGQDLQGFLPGQRFDLGVVHRRMKHAMRRLIAHETHLPELPIVLANRPLDFLLYF